MQVAGFDLEIAPTESMWGNRDLEIAPTKRFHAESDCSGFVNPLRADSVDLTYIDPVCDAS